MSTAEIGTSAIAVETVEPIGDRLLLQRHPEEEMSRGGIFKPDVAREKPGRATVIAVGPGRLLDSGVRVPLSAKRGDTVLLGQFSGIDIMINEEPFVMISEDELLGIVRS